ncbi:MAG: hypothetical protein RJA49_2933, partial [Actinomycetota bacterium]
MSTPDARARSAALRSRAQALRSTGRIRDALDVLRDAVAAAPDDPANFCEIGLCQLDAENWSEARRAGSSALSLQPHSQLALRIVALSGCHTPGGSREALDAAKRAVALGPSEPTNVNALARVYLEMGTLNAARAQAERALQLAPTLSYVHGTAGSIALAQGRLKAAEHHFRELLHDDPNSWSAENNRGVVGLGGGRGARAARHFLSSIRARPDQLPIENLQLTLKQAFARVGNIYVTIVAIAVQILAPRSWGLGAAASFVGALVVPAVVLLARRRAPRAVRV